MSNLRPIDQSPSSGSRVEHLRGRWPVYAALVAAAIVILAYIDGGEEPIHPIVQSVSLGEQVSETD